MKREDSMHLVPAPAVRLMKSRVTSRSGKHSVRKEKERTGCYRELKEKFRKMEKREIMLIMKEMTAKTLTACLHFPKHSVSRLCWSSFFSFIFCINSLIPSSSILHWNSWLSFLSLIFLSSFNCGSINGLETWTTAASISLVTAVAISVPARSYQRFKKWNQGKNTKNKDQRQRCRRWEKNRKIRYT